jgi:hypothetical protein
MEGAVLNHKIQIKQSAPGIQMYMVEQPIPHRTAHEEDSEGPSSGDQRRPEGDGNTRKAAERRLGAGIVCHADE